MDLKELESYIKLAKKHKLKSMNFGEVSFELREPIKRQNTRAVTQGEIPTTGDMPSDDEMLYMSADSAIQIPNSF